jgi:hypothetical protein
VSDDGVRSDAEGPRAPLTAAEQAAFTAFVQGLVTQ